MPRWWTKLSPITSAKSVRLFAHHSFKARIANLLILMFAVCVCVISPLPLSPSLYLLGLVISQALRGPLIPQPIFGLFSVTQSGELMRFNSVPFSTKVLFAYAPVFIVFSGKNGKSCSLWRDSLTDKEYRNLLVYLRYSQDKSK